MSLRAVGPASHEAGYGIGVEPGSGAGSVPPLTRRATGGGWSREGIGIGPASHEAGYEEWSAGRRVGLEGGLERGLERGLAW